MGAVGIILSVFAAIALALSLFVCIKFKNVKLTLILGLVAIALVFGFVISSADKNDAGKKGGQASSPSPSIVGTSGPDVDVNAVPIQTQSPSPSATAKPTESVGQTATQKPVETEKQTFVSAETYTVPPVATPDGKPNGSTIYLTFDDGPSEVTSGILDTLALYNVKATFFIVNFDDSQVPLLKRMVREGHTIGIHGYSHEYKDIYKSLDAATENIIKLRDKIRDKVGYDATVTRFPGGSSNQTSIQYCKGVMTQLVKWTNENGFTYVDWNVDPSDALSKLSSDEVFARVKERTKSSRKANVVLMHDFGGQTGTAGAVDDIIEWGKANGYSFDRLTKDSPECHHAVAN